MKFFQHLTLTALVFAGSCWLNAAPDVFPGGTPPAVPVVPSPLANTDRAAGDDAFSVGDYAIAASFYGKYREQAKKANQTAALREANEREIDALILAGLPDAAEKALLNFETDLPGVNALSVSMWQADILLLRRKAADAVAVFERILPGFTQLDPRRTRVLFGYAFALELQKNYARAAEVYGMIYETLRESGFGHFAFERRVLNLAAAGESKQALEELISFPPPANERDTQALRLLNLYLLMRTQGVGVLMSDRLQNVKIPQKLKNDSFFFLVMSLIGDGAVAGNNYPLAVDAYKLAYDAAQTQTDAYDAIRRLTDVLAKKNDKEAAAALALRQYQLFKSAFADPEAKMRVARLLVNASKNAPALEIYASVYNAAAQPENVRGAALREAAAVLVGIQDFRAAEKLIRDYYKNQPGDDGSMSMLLAELLFKQNRFEQSAAAYQSAAAQYPLQKWSALSLAAKSLMNAGDFAAAARLAGSVYDAPDAPVPLKNDALYLRASAELKQELYPSALADFLLYAGRKDIDPDQGAGAWYQAARICFRDQKFADAERYFRKLVSLYPRHALAVYGQYWLINTLFAHGHESQAEKETWKMQELYPGFKLTLTALFNLAAHYADSGAGEKAGGVLDRLSNRSDFPEIQAKAIYEKALLNFHSGRHDLAARLLKSLEERFPANSSLPDAYYLQGDIARLAGDYDNALIDYRKAAELRPESMLELAAIGSTGDVYFAMASKADDSEKFKPALEAYEKLLAARDIPPVLQAMAVYKAGRTLQLMNRDEEALIRYKSLLLMVPPAEAEQRPGERLWCVKAVEGIVDLAAQRPLTSNIEAAMTGIKWLRSAGIIGEDLAAQRISTIKRLRFRP